MSKTVVRYSDGVCGAVMMPDGLGIWVMVSGQMEHWRAGTYSYMYED